MGQSVFGLPLNKGFVNQRPTLTTFTSSGTWRKPPGCTWIKVTLSGGGSGGGGWGAPCTASYGYGNGGAIAILWLDVTNISFVPITIGAASSGGSGGSLGNCFNASPSSTAGTSTFGSMLTAAGGNGSNSNTAAVATAALTNIPGYAITMSGVLHSLYNGIFGSKGYGAGGDYTASTGANGSAGGAGICYVEEYYS